MGFKKVMAMVLVTALTFGSAMSVYAAAESPTAATVAPGTDNSSDDHTGNIVVAKVTKKAVTVTKVTGEGKGAAVVSLVSAKDANGKNQAITVIGTGKKGVFDSKKGRKVTSVIIKSKKKVLVKKIAFKGSKVKNLNLTKAKKAVTISKNAFKGTKAKKLTLKIKSAKKLVLKKGAFNGLTQITIKGASKSVKKAVQKKLKKAGFKGTIK